MSEESIDQKTSPMMVQWHACKKAAGNALLFFRLGDFYEAFHDDAVIMARELELTLTKRQEVPMCGMPHHTHEVYIDRLIAKGYRVAMIEEQGVPIELVETSLTDEELSVLEQEKLGKSY